MGCCESSEERDRLTAYEWLPPAMEAPPTLPSQTQTDEKLPNVRRRPLRSKTDSQSEPILPEMPRHEWLPPHFSQFYDLGAVMGVGTTSKVYRVYHRISKLNHNSEHALACKVINKRRITTSLKKNDIEPLLGQLRKEVDILRRINHCNIVSFVDFMETRSKLFIITERLDGGELFDHLLNHGPLREGVACQVLYGVFSAVAYLHERGVVHRDIKAENLIFFHDPWGRLSLKLIDFGFSTILRHDLTGSFMGTGGYIAPEIRQNKNYSASVDSWSLGVLLYCTLSAKLPFTISIDQLPSSTAECRGAFKLVFPSPAWAWISSNCRDLISLLLEIDPIQRGTPKDALRHSWFKHERKRQRQEPLPALDGVDAGTDGTDASAGEGVGVGRSVHSAPLEMDHGPAKELPALHSALRQSRSISQLERKGYNVEAWSEWAAVVDREKERANGACGDSWDIGRSGDSRGDGVSGSSGAGEQGKHEERKEEGYDMPPKGSSANSNDSAATSNDSGTTGGSASASETDFSAASDTKREGIRSINPAQSIPPPDTSVSRARVDLHWVEWHDPRAGDLFYATYSPQR
mmetsp:Transcript_25902/g.55993  ORF Transcript_25902/g.55993 Transcript_25902/m.55993 type:complete len:577 (-) Transcript_25902:632-2362(-)